MPSHDVPDYVRILDSLHGVEIPFYHALQIHDAVDEACETDTFLKITVTVGTITTVYEVASAKVEYDRRYARLILNSHPKVSEIEDLIYEKTLPHDGVYIALHASVSVRIADITSCILERS